MPVPDINYAPLILGGYQGTPDKWIEVFVDARNPDVWSISGHPNPEMNGDHPAPDRTHSDTMKFSNSAYIRVKVIGRLRGGVEDVVDINNSSHHIEIDIEEWESGGLYVATVKGGSHDITLSGCIVKHGSETDIDLGNWSDQSMHRTVGVVLNLTSAEPVRYRVLHAWVPYIENPGQKYKANLTWKGCFYAIYRVLKKLHLA